MKWKTWAPAIAAIVLGGIAAKVAKDSMSKHHEAAGPAKAVQVVVVKGNIIPGEDVKAEQISLLTVSGVNAPADAFNNPNDVVGRIATAPMTNGQTILNSFLAPRGASGGLPSLVPLGMRAITINVDETNGIAGMLSPGCRVDVVAAIMGETRDKTVSRTIVPNALIQAVGQRLTAVRAEDSKDGPPPMYRNITMIVTLREAQLIDLASATSRVRLLLRGIRDNEEIPLDVVTLADLHGEPTTRPSGFGIASSNTPKRQVTVIRGVTETKVEMELPPPSFDAGSFDQRDRVLPGKEEPFQD